MNETEAKRRATLAVIPLAVAIVGVIGTGLGLGADAIGLPSHFAESHTVAEAVRVITNSLSPVVIFGGLRMVVEHGRESLQILATGVGVTVIAGIGIVAGAKKS